MIAFDLVQGVFRAAYCLVLMFKARWFTGSGRESGQEKREESRIAVSSTISCSAPDPFRVSEAMEESRDSQSSGNFTTNPECLGGQSLIRYGQGYSVVCHFYRNENRVVRVLWLDYQSLARKYGAYVVRRLRTRAGEVVNSLQSGGAGMRVKPQRPWGRISLPDEQLEFESLQDLRVVRLMEKTLEDAGLLIEEEIPDNLLNKRPWRILPPSPATAPELDRFRKNQQDVEKTMGELRQEDAARKVPLASQNKQYPGMEAPKVVTSHKGVLRKTGYVERKDLSGRTYRTFFADIEDDARTLRHTGVDLQRAFLREQIEIGDRVEVFNIGLAPVGEGKYKKKIWSARKMVEA